MVTTSASAPPQVVAVVPASGGPVEVALLGMPPPSGGLVHGEPALGRQSPSSGGWFVCGEEHAPTQAAAATHASAFIGAALWAEPLKMAHFPLSMPGRRAAGVEGVEAIEGGGQSALESHFDRRCERDREARARFRIELECETDIVQKGR